MVCYFAKATKADTRHRTDAGLKKCERIWFLNKHHCCFCNELGSRDFGAGMLARLAPNTKSIRAKRLSHGRLVTNNAKAPFWSTKLWRSAQCNAKSWLITPSKKSMTSGQNLVSGKGKQRARVKPPSSVGVMFGNVIPAFSVKCVVLQHYIITQ